MQTTRQYSVITLALFTSALLTGCGGGSGGGAVAPAAPVGPVVSTLSFPLRASYNTLIANGFARPFTVTGNCTGSGNNTDAPATTPAVFEANPAALSAASTLTATLTSTPGFVCIATLATTSTSYYDSTYTPLGSNIVGGDYGVYLIAPNIPATAVVGGTGVIGTETLYTNSTKVTGNGRIDSSYVIEADTATTAIVNAIGKVYNAAGTLIGTQQGRYRIAATGALVPVSIDLQYPIGIQFPAGMHMLFTYN